MFDNVLNGECNNRGGLCMLLKLGMLFEKILTKQAIFRIFSSKMASCCKIVEIDSSMCGSTSCSSITKKHFKPILVCCGFLKRITSRKVAVSKQLGKQISGS